MKKIILFFALFTTYTTSAATIERATLRATMEQGVNIKVVEPDAASSKECPVVYLLHGYGKDENYWATIADLEQFADQYDLFIICLDGNNSWYWDCPQESTKRYETFLSEELPAYIDDHYNTIANRSARAITGLSMGGHGALWTAIRHSDIYGAAGSMSGGVDIRPFPENWGMKGLLGDQENNKEAWESHTTINQIDKISNGELALMIDCGVDDFFIEVNRNMHQALLERGISHDYIEREGAHNDKYWHNSINYHMLFFHRFFNASQPQE